MSKIKVYQSYKLKIQHDNGFMNLTISAQDEEDAKQRIMNIEGCPECAIKSCIPNTHIPKLMLSL